MATKRSEPQKVLTNFDVWKESLTPDFIAAEKFIVLSCGCCPAKGITCNKYDTTCRGNFLIWANTKHEELEDKKECEK